MCNSEQRNTGIKGCPDFRVARDGGISGKGMVTSGIQHVSHGATGFFRDAREQMGETPGSIDTRSIAGILPTPFRPKAGLRMTPRGEGPTTGD